MSLSREARIGLLVTISVVIFFVGFYFLKGANLFSGENEYYCFYDNVQGLQASSNVQIRGLNVGHVSRTQLIDGKGVRVVIAISKKIKIPKNTIATLVSSDLLGTKIIRLDLGNSPEYIDNGASIAARIEGGALDNISVEVSPLIKEVSATIANLDTTLVSINNVINTQTQQSLRNSIASLDSTTHNFAMLSKNLNTETVELGAVIHSANSVTSNLAKNNEHITTMLTNVATATDQLAKAPIQQAFTDIEKASKDLQGIVNKINSGQGSLGQMVNDKQLYNNLNTSLTSLDNLMNDIKSHPTRYINVTIFGKKKQ